jgi:hypothetical protein
MMPLRRRFNDLWQGQVEPTKGCRWFDLTKVEPGLSVNVCRLAHQTMPSIGSLRKGSILGSRQLTESTRSYLQRFDVSSKFDARIGVISVATSWIARAC